MNENMNDNRVTLDYIASRLASAKGLTPVFAEKFAGEFFKTVQDILAESRALTVKGLGRFVTDDDGNVMFEAEASVASRVNEPFECFEPIELDDNEDVIIEKSEESDDTESDDEPITEAEPASEVVTVAEAVSEVEAEDVEVDYHVDDENDVAVSTSDSTELQQEDDTTGTSVAMEIVPDQISETSDIAQVETESPDSSMTLSPDDESVDDSASDIEDYVDDNQECEPKRSGRKQFILGLILGLIIGAAITLAVNKYLLNESGKETVIAVSEQPVTTSESNKPALKEETSVDDNAADESENSHGKLQPMDSNADMPKASEVAPAPKAPEVVTETVTSTNYLASMARRHYGRFEFWVYIYEENAAKLNNPDLIEPNTVVVIPPAEKYSIDKNNPESVARAVAKAKEIYSRFK